MILGIGSDLANIERIAATAGKVNSLTLNQAGEVLQEFSARLLVFRKEA